MLSPPPLAHLLAPSPTSPSPRGGPRPPKSCAWGAHGPARVQLPSSDKQQEDNERSERSCCWGGAGVPPPPPSALDPPLRPPGWGLTPLATVQSARSAPLERWAGFASQTFGFFLQENRFLGGLGVPQEDPGWGSGVGGVTGTAAPRSHPRCSGRGGGAVIWAAAGGSALDTPWLAQPQKRGASGMGAPWGAGAGAGCSPHAEVPGVTPTPPAPRPAPGAQRSRGALRLPGRGKRGRCPVPGGGTAGCPWGGEGAQHQ